MKKFTKQLLTGVITLGLLAPVATSTLNTNPQTTAQAKARWHRGEPGALKHYRSYISGFRYMKYVGRTKIVLAFSNSGTGAFNLFYNRRGHIKSAGNGWGDWWEA